MDAATWIALGSLAVAVAALVVAVLAALYARRQAKEAARANRLAERQRVEDIAPTFTLTLDASEALNVLLWLELLPGQVDLDSVAVDVIDDASTEGALVEFTPDQNGVAAGATRLRRHATYSPLPRGHRACWRVALPEAPRAPRLRLEVTSHGQGYQWKTVVETAVPPDVMSTVA